MVLLDPHWFDSWSDPFDGDHDRWRPQKHVWCSKQATWCSAEETGRTIQRRLYACKNLLGLLYHNLQVLNARVDGQQASLGWITSSFLWHILQDQLTWTTWLKISCALTTSARMTLDCRLVGSNAKLLTLVAMCQWLCCSVNVWHGECDEPDGGKRGILLWRMIVNWCYRFPV